MAVTLELHLDNLQISSDIEEKVRKRINKMENGHHDITQAFLSIKQLSGKPTVNEYEARLVLYHKPENLTAAHRSSDIPEAILGALNSGERQLRSARATLRDKRRRAAANVEVLLDPKDSTFDAM